nr:DUF547 domain-containing protein [uncultured Pedobacter sp.]
MKKTMKIIAVLFIIASVASCGVQRPKESDKPIESTKFNQLSENMIANLKANKSVADIQKALANASEDELEKTLALDEQRKAFWINVYNGYIIAILKKDKDQFKDRGTFFGKKQINIAGNMLSFDDIENGMIRKSQYKFGLGYVGKIFPPSFERRLRVKHRDFHIHFAINCGAKSCPPVRLYKAETVNKQLENVAKVYLTKHTKFDKSKNLVTTSTLTSWFRGDFGGKSGTKKILKEFGLIPQDSNPAINYESYDWTLDINNYAD